MFLSPARRGIGILVPLGFCPASSVRRKEVIWTSGVTFSCGRKNSKTTGKFFDIPSKMGMCEWFFRDATKIENGRQRSAPKFFVVVKTLKLKIRNFSILLSHSPRYGNVQVTFSRFYWNSKWPPQINFNFFVGAIILIIFFLNFNITFQAAWGCASDFLKMLL